MLGTFNATPPRPITANDLGVDELPNFPKGFVDQMVLPFIYKPGEGEPERYRKQAERSQNAGTGSTANAGCRRVNGFKAFIPVTPSSARPELLLEHMRPRAVRCLGD